MNEKEFIAYLRNGAQATLKYTTDREDVGGYLVPEYIVKDRRGFIAWLWRKAGQVSRREDWHERGTYRIVLAGRLREIAKLSELVKPWPTQVPMTQEQVDDMVLDKNDWRAKQMNEMFGVEWPKAE